MLINNYENANGVNWIKMEHVVIHTWWSARARSTAVPSKQPFLMEPNISKPINSRLKIGQIYCIYRMA